MKSIFLSTLFSATLMASQAFAFSLSSPSPSAALSASPSASPLAAPSVMASASPSTTFSPKIVKSKYGMEAVPISFSHDFFQKQAGPDYWALAPYYTAQQNGASCSIASVTMVINAARSGASAMALTADDELVSQNSLLKKTADERWKGSVGPTGGGVTLEQLRQYVEESFKAYGLGSVDVDVMHAQKTDDFKKKLHEALVQNEKTSNDFIIANFIQGTYTGDTDVGHIAPVGAYDAKRKRVLIMDPDREWYEPYWISEDTFLNGMATSDPSSGMTRGFLWIKRVPTPKP